MPRVVLYTLLCTRPRIEMFRTVQIFLSHVSTLTLHKCFCTYVHVDTYRTIKSFNVDLPSWSRVVRNELVLYTCSRLIRTVQFLFYTCPRWHVSHCSDFYFTRGDIGMCRTVQFLFLTCPRCHVAYCAILLGTCLGLGACTTFSRCTGASFSGFSIYRIVFCTCTSMQCTVRTIHVLHIAPGRMCGNTN